MGPSGAAGGLAAAREIGGRQVRLFRTHRVRVPAERQGRIGVAQHVSDSPDAPARLERERGPPVTAAGTQVAVPILRGRIVNAS